MIHADTNESNVNVDQEPRLEIESVTKRFPGVVALDDVSLRVMPAETLAVIGENGAGKSTLMKVLAGIQSPDSGTIRMASSPSGRTATVSFRSPGAAMAAGISLIHQELNLHENLSVAENIFLGREPHHRGWLDRGSMADQALQHLDRVGLDVSPHASLSTLSTAARQLVEVAKALSTGASVVIMDEPTSSLSTTEAERLFDVVRSLRQDGVSVVYISHRLGEVVRLADRVEVLRDGKNAGTLTGAQINHDAMVSAMVGRDVDRLFDRRPHTAGETKLKVDQLRMDFQPVQPISLEIRAGEVVGIAGLVGSGRSELLETIFGVRPAEGGQVSVANHTIRPGDVRRSIDAGLALVPEDRKQTGLLIESSVRANATLAAMKDAAGSPWLRPRWEQTVTAELIKQLLVKTASQETVIANLSGGNQQKVALGKWLMCQPQVLMLDEPTRGVDVGAKEEIYSLLDRLAGEGLAILFVSSEIEEILAIADRVLVMHEGGISGRLRRDELTEEAIMRLAVGLTHPQ